MGYNDYDGSRNFNRNNRNNRNNSNNRWNDRNNFSNRGDSKFQNSNYINSPEIKQKLVDYIYNSMDICKYKYKLLQVESDLSYLKSGKHYVSPNYNGINSLIVFIKLRNKYYSFIVDRRTLSYNRSQLNLDKVKMIPFNIRLDETIYNGSIFDGVLLYNTPNQRNNSRNKIFMINDVYTFRGDTIINDKINHKILNINAYLNSCQKKDDRLNNMELIVNNLFEFEDIKKLVHNYIIKSRFKNSIKGLAFYPESSGTKHIYLYSNVSSGKVEEDKHINDTKKSLIPKETKLRDSNITQNGKTAVFRIKKTDIPDVYNLYIAEIKKGVHRYKKHCIAYVPTSQCSYFCKDILSKKDSALVKCNYISDKKKWTPFECVKDRKIPDKLEDVQ